MSTLYIERSVGDARDGTWVERLELAGVDRIVVGTGPGSFAGIRSALAFAQGYALGTGCGVFGLPSPCALVEGEGPLAVVGDARQGKFWIALFDGFRLVTDVFQVDRETLPYRVPVGVKVVTPDGARIDAVLKELFGECYAGNRVPTGEGLKRFAEANPAALVKEPLPIYLNPAVRG